jgi:hypothetical protein
VGKQYCIVCPASVLTLSLFLILGLLQDELPPQSEYHKEVVQRFVGDMLAYYASPEAPRGAWNFDIIKARCNKLGYFTF